MELTINTPAIAITDEMKAQKSIETFVHLNAIHAVTE